MMYLIAEATYPQEAGAEGCIEICNLCINGTGAGGGKERAIFFVPNGCNPLISPDSKK
jgi:hypothetical protein